MAIEILYTIRFNVGPQKGNIINMTVDLEDLEIGGITDIIISKKYLKCWVNDNEYEIIDRQLI